MKNSCSVTVACYSLIYNSIFINSDLKTLFAEDTKEDLCLIWKSGLWIARTNRHIKIFRLHCFSQVKPARLFQAVMNLYSLCSSHWFLLMQELIKHAYGNQNDHITDQRSLWYFISNFHRESRRNLSPNSSTKKPASFSRCIWGSLLSYTGCLFELQFQSLKLSDNKWNVLKQGNLQRMNWFHWTRLGPTWAGGPPFIE